MRALITGISGSGGSYLAEYLLDNCPGVVVHGLSRWHSTDSGNNLKSVRSRVSVHEGDLNDLSSVMRILGEVSPSVIFHLASYANVRASFDSPCSVLGNNVLGTCNLFEAIRILGAKPIIQMCSTSEVYGQVDPKYVPIKEDTPFNPASPYAVSKVAQDLLGQVYFKSYGIHIIRTRMFTYLNPRRADLFASAFAKQIAYIENGLQENKLYHGNLKSVRTILDVRDAMSAYCLAVVSCCPGEAYNIGGTDTMSVGAVLETLLSFTSHKIETLEDPSLLRPSDVTLQIPCTDKFVAATGWKPKYSFEESLLSLLAYWRSEAFIGRMRVSNV